MATYEKSSVVKGHHVCKFVWMPVIGQELKTKLEEDNEHDKHAVAVLLDDQIVGHLPRSISRVSRFFLCRGGLIACRVTGKRRHGDGLEVPCVYVYHGLPRIVKKLHKLLDCY